MWSGSVACRSPSSTAASTTTSAEPLPDRSAIRSSSPNTLRGRGQRSRVAGELRRVLVVHDGVVADVLDQPVLRDEDPKRLVTGVYVLVHVVLRHVDGVVGLELP